MKALVIYHAPHCNDGFTAAWAAYTGIMKVDHTSEVMLYPMSYKEDDDRLLLEHLVKEKYDWIYVVDFSLRIPVLDQIMGLQKDMNGLTILDHHKTAFEMYAPTHEVTKESSLKRMMYDGKVLIILKNDMSGAALAWYHWNSGNLPVLIQFVQDRDLWTFYLPDTRAIHMYLSNAPYTIGDWDQIAFMLESPKGYIEIVSEGQHLHVEYIREVQEIVSRAEPCIIRGHVGLMVDCHGKYASDVGHKLSIECGTYGLMYTEIEDGLKLYCSIRSEGSYDVEVIAKYFGGGGHLNAAGFVIDVEEMMGVFEEKHADTREVEV